MYSFILKNGTIVDGTGYPAYQADVAVTDGKIAAIGSFEASEAEKCYDVTGLTVTSGFIDWHSHSDLALLLNLNAFNALEQGITTEIGGHCGLSIAPLNTDDPEIAAADIPEDQLQAIGQACSTFGGAMALVQQQKIPTNIAIFVGHGAIRAKVMGYDARQPSDAELEQMKEIVREAMEHGAMGLSTGLIYPPGAYAKPEEIQELCKVVAEYGGGYASHMRSEGNGLIDSIKETLEVGRVCGIPVQISHMKVAGRHNRGKSVEALRLIDEAIRQGQIVGIDQYPYDGGATSLISSLPPRFATAGQAVLAERLNEPELRAEIIAEVSVDSNSFENLIYGSTPEGVLISSQNEALNGKYLSEIAAERGKDPYETLLDILYEEKGHLGAIYRMICEWDMENIMRNPLTMIGIDGAHSDDREPRAGHPRNWATYPRLIGTFCRDKHFISLEQCIRKMTGQAAEMANFPDKGHIQVGQDADIVVFDFATINGKADYNNIVANEGIKYVFVNGVLAVEDGVGNGARAGKLMLHEKK